MNDSFEKLIDIEALAHEVENLEFRVGRELRLPNGGLGKIFSSASAGSDIDRQVRGLKDMILRGKDGSAAQSLALILSDPETFAISDARASIGRGLGDVCTVTPRYSLAETIVFAEQILEGVPESARRRLVRSSYSLGAIVNAYVENQAYWGPQVEHFGECNGSYKRTIDPALGIKAAKDVVAKEIGKFRWIPSFADPLYDLISE